MRFLRLPFRLLTWAMAGAGVALFVLLGWLAESSLRQVSVTAVDRAGERQSGFGVRWAKDLSGLMPLAASAAPRRPRVHPTLARRFESLLSGVAQVTEVPEPTEPVPTPEPVVETPEPPSRCRSGPPAPRFFWTLYVAPRVAGGTGMWVPFGENGGPFLKAYVKALYGDVWYGARLDPLSGRIIPDPIPAWPRPDLIRSGSSGIQTTRTGNPMCGRAAESTVPPCYAELVVPLVFLDRLAPEGPYLRKAYFWLPSNQVVVEAGRPSRVAAVEYDSLVCDPRQTGMRLSTARPVYADFSGCSSASRRIDTCYLAGCGDLWMHCQ